MRFDGLRCNGGAATGNGEGEQGSGIGRGLPGGRMPYVVVRYSSSIAMSSYLQGGEGVTPSQVPRLT